MYLLSKGDGMYIEPSKRVKICIRALKTAQEGILIFSNYSVTD
jgi:hypothetical protein